MSQQQQLQSLLGQDEWSMILRGKELQDMSNAVAKQYRLESDRTSSSHLHHKSDHYDVPNGSYSESLQYSEGDNSSEKSPFIDEPNTLQDGKPAPKKPGRKLLTTEPANKRKAQNRAAQRAFRERKEHYVKSLEDRIKELEEMQPKSDSKLSEENLNLKVLVQKLETENYFLKEQPFTFDFPISQPGLYNAIKAREDATAQNAFKVQLRADRDRDTSLESFDVSFGMVSAIGAKHIGSDILPWTPSSSGGDSVPNSPLTNDLTAPEQDFFSHIVPMHKSSTSGTRASFALLMDGMDRTFNNTDMNLNNKGGSSSISSFDGINNINSTADSIGQIHASIFGNTGLRNNQLTNEGSPANFANTPLSLFGTDNDGAVRFTPLVAPMSVPSVSYDQSRGLFTDFREPLDPIDIFSGLDDTTVFPEKTVGDIFNNSSLDYKNTFVNVNSSPTKDETQVAAATSDESTSSKHTLPPLDENEKAIPCPQAWEQIAKHPKFDDADIDDLCAELKAKAKCSGHGPMISLSDVDKLMSRLDQE
ncbi:DNA-binding transcription factor yap1 [Mortierella sp. AM989]|nr:DNA-binding transcription factor yap1 [Mortierella sp. AM989]